MSQGFAITSLTPDIERAGFRCGTEALDRYFSEIVTQDIKRRVASCYVAREVGTGVVAGFYTLSASSVPLTDLPEAMRKKLPRYPSVPVARIGRLAVDERFKGTKLGAALLWDAIERAARSEVTVYAVAVDAKDEAAEGFYRWFRFSTPGYFLDFIRDGRAQYNREQFRESEATSLGRDVLLYFL